MTLKERIDCLCALGSYLTHEPGDSFMRVIHKGIAENPWFTEASIRFAIARIAKDYLAKDNILAWVSKYDIAVDSPKRIGLILAGNIPMEGIHDVIAVFISGHIACIKYSTKDKVLLSHLIQQLKLINPDSERYFVEVERVNNVNAVIATSGSSTATHFESYFSKYPHIIRKNRSSVAALTGNESSDQLKDLGLDIFTYFGLGCRNVSKIFVPEGYNFDLFFESIVDFGYVINHNKYKNNFDYSNAIYILGQHPFLTNNFLIIREQEPLDSRISCVHYEYYKDTEQLVSKLKSLSEELQSVASLEAIDNIPHILLGRCQHPSLEDYADHTDTLAFLINLKD